MNSRGIYPGNQLNFNIVANNISGDTEAAPFHIAHHVDGPFDRTRQGCGSGPRYPVID